MERVRFKETVFLETSDSLFLLVSNYAGSNFIGQYLACHLRLKINCIIIVYSDGKTQSLIWQ